MQSLIRNLVVVALSSTCLIQPVVAAEPAIITDETDLRPLPGKLNSTQVFNSNSPEVVQTEGVLLSTFPSKGMRFPSAHLNHLLSGTFDIFFHHISNGMLTKSIRTVFVGIVAHNPNPRNAVLKINRAAKYISQPDAPFKSLPAIFDNAQGDVWAGPGDRVTSDFLHHKQNDPIWPNTIVIPPNQTRVIAALPIPISMLTPPLNGLSGMIQVESSRPVYVATLALNAKTNADNVEVVPDLTDWDSALHNDDLVRPREKQPTVPGTKTSIVYGRVAGVSIGNTWEGIVTDAPNAKFLSVHPGTRISYPISSIEQGAFGTGQIQSAGLAVRYPDTAFQSHGNYGVHYSLQIPLHNTAKEECVVTMLLQTPLKSDERKGELKFYETPPTRVFFRGSVRVRYTNDDGIETDKYVHLVENRGERSSPLVQMMLKAGEHRKAQIDFYYPPDATPPQVLTIKGFPLD